MKILLTGATGYIGKRLLPVLISQGHHVVCCVRDANRFNPPESLRSSLTVVEVDMLDAASLANIPADCQGAYYLIHSMSSAADYSRLEKLSAIHFKEALRNTSIEHVVYLSGIVNEESLSEHLASRKAVEMELADGNYHFTTLRAGIIIGSGSASFEIIRDLVEKLPVMVTPKWLNTRCQPIGVQDVITFLGRALFNTRTYDRNFDIGGPEILTYREMLLGYAKVRGLKRWIFTVPVMTPKLSSYWLYFITSTSFKLASALVSSMKIEVICKPNDINEVLALYPEGYEAALRKTFHEIDDHQIISSWKDSLISGRFDLSLSDFLVVPTHGCMVDTRTRRVLNAEDTLDKIWRIGGESGWYFWNWLWVVRGFIDKLFGGVGLRRGRTNATTIASGDAIDFWRVLYANRQEGRLLLFAEMKLPGEAWLEFRMQGKELRQTATFRPKGLLGRMYWYVVFPLHVLIFRGLIRQLAGEHQT
ncbi:MAG: SDR family oxidoreductase [Cytophagales bacterium]|nr:SDR family oxidoreductase [Cytophagales bacterium]